MAELTSAAILAGAPCTSGDPAWISPRSTAAEVAEACLRCRSCLVLVPCGEAARELRPSFGVWAGRRYGAAR
ncbi:WhiB family transcriptional regulator [Cellulomonas persica]|uniref:WhiB family transcriptional regulator n=1 Tax=Cellulomonas persica TaxID=76861 RepID=UPI0011BE4BF8|nr:WhiB family transcriptional regulator [Cellulomonas persica]